MIHVDDDDMITITAHKDSKFARTVLATAAAQIDQRVREYLDMMQELMGRSFANDRRAAWALEKFAKQNPDRIIRPMEVIEELGEQTWRRGRKHLIRSGVLTQIEFGRGRGQMALYQLKGGWTLYDEVARTFGSHN